MLGWMAFVAVGHEGHMSWQADVASMLTRVGLISDMEFYYFFPR